MKICHILVGTMLITNLGYAQDIDCTDFSNSDQMQMNQCSYLAYQAADEDLNLAYGLARDTLKSNDADIAEIYGELPEGYQRGVIILRDAQRAWIAFRDLSCQAEGQQYYGGSIRPLIENTCKESLTRQRTEQLRAAFEEN
jgi:uncharacterized protein YecT (DUF1311 family)